MNKTKVMMICDHPLIPSGVGTQAKYLIEGLLRTGKYSFFVLGGAIKHPDYRLMVVDKEKYGEDFKVLPVDGYGDKDKLRSLIGQEKPDILFLFTDPRFFTWIWEIEDEIRSVCPIVYWHVWDNDPTPKFNKIFYDSTDHVAALSMKTFGMLKDMNCQNISYIPHAVPGEIFRPVSEEECAVFKKSRFGPHADKKFIVFWNNRNARRKMTGDVIATFAKFASKVGKKNVALAMHTQVGDPEGQNIIEVAKCFDIESNLMISEQRVPSEEINMFYNACDVTVNIANNEGFGLGTLESMMAGTPIIVHMTGGLQYQIGNWWQTLSDFTDQEHLTLTAKTKWKSGKGLWTGIPVFSSSRSCTGSQPIPYIYDDRVSHDDVVDALVKMYEIDRGRRRSMGRAARDWAEKTFSMNEMIVKWDEVLTVELTKSRILRDSGKNRIRSADV